VSPPSGEERARGPVTPGLPQEVKRPKARIRRRTGTVLLRMAG
jgi:hypothetical protein